MFSWSLESFQKLFRILVERNEIATISDVSDLIKHLLEKPLDEYYTNLMLLEE